MNATTASIVTKLVKAGFDVDPASNRSGVALGSWLTRDKVRVCIEAEGNITAIGFAGRIGYSPVEWEVSFSAATPAAMILAALKEAR